eukprot:gene10127-21111_t
MSSESRISYLEEKWKEERLHITLRKKPLLTLKLFGAGLYKVLKNSGEYMISHPVFSCLVLPASVMWICLEQIPGPYTEAINLIEFTIQYVIWWVGLGILSSIGLGSGLQSGVLFLFPHIIKTCLAAQACHTLDFESETEIWMRSPPNLFKCPTMIYQDSTPVTFFGIYKRVIISSFLWSAGTAIGEIPPYWISHASRLAAIKSGGNNTNSEEMPEELLETDSDNKWINKAKSFMIRFLKTHGFYGVLMLASWPNMAFDLCGICCGHFLMPFWTFFGATFIGKACFRNSYQTLFLVALISDHYLERLIQLLQRLTPDFLHLDAYIRDALEKGRQSFQQGSETSVNDASTSTTSTSLLIALWQIIMTFLLVLFLLSCMEQSAQFYQLMMDSDEIDRLRAVIPDDIKSDIQKRKRARKKGPEPAMNLEGIPEPVAFTGDFFAFSTRIDSDINDFDTILGESDNGSRNGTGNKSHNSIATAISTSTSTGQHLTLEQREKHHYYDDNHQLRHSISTQFTSSGSGNGRASIDTRLPDDYFGYSQSTRQ